MRWSLIILSLAGCVASEPFAREVPVGEGNYNPPILKEKYGGAWTGDIKLWCGSSFQGGKSKSLEITFQNNGVIRGMFDGEPFTATFKFDSPEFEGLTETGKKLSISDYRQVFTNEPAWKNVDLQAEVSHGQRCGKHPNGWWDYSITYLAF